MTSAKAARLRDRLNIDPDAPPARTAPPPEPSPQQDHRASTAPASSGRGVYRSFYVHDDVYDRFRDAIHWTARRPDAAGRAPANMSAAVEAFMAQLAGELETEFNNGQRFPAAPTQRRKGC